MPYSNQYVVFRVRGLTRPCSAADAVVIAVGACVWTSGGHLGGGGGSGAGDGRSQREEDGKGGVTRAGGHRVAAERAR